GAVWGAGAGGPGGGGVGRGGGGGREGERGAGVAEHGERGNARCRAGRGASGVAVRGGAVRRTSRALKSPKMASGEMFGVVRAETRRAGPCEVRPSDGRAER